MKATRSCALLFGALVLIFIGYNLGQVSTKNQAAPESVGIIPPAEAAEAQPELKNCYDFDSGENEYEEPEPEYKPYVPPKPTLIGSVATQITLVIQGSPVNLNTNNFEVWTEASPNDSIYLGIGVANTTNSPLSGVMLKIEKSDGIVRGQSPDPSSDARRYWASYDSFINGTAEVRTIIPGNRDPFGDWTGMESQSCSGFAISSSAEIGGTEEIKYLVGKEGYDWFEIRPKVKIMVR